jgi:tRNA U34 5-carboxymethylaminomethyl modifying GTPase MnmE/TrmE
MRKTLLVVLGILFLLNVQAQNRPDRSAYREQIKAAKVAFITNKLDLNSETAQVFWPIFNEYEKEKSELARKYYDQKRGYAKDRGDYSSMSEADAKKMLEVYVIQKEAEAKIEKDYLPKFQKVLSAQQTWLLITSEAEFRRSLMQRLGRSREDGNPGKNAPKKKGN